MWKLYDENWSEIKLKPAGDNVAIDNKQAGEEKETQTKAETSEANEWMETQTKYLEWDSVWVWDRECMCLAGMTCWHSACDDCATLGPAQLWDT